MSIWDQCNMDKCLSIAFQVHFSLGAFFAKKKNVFSFYRCAVWLYYYLLIVRTWYKLSVVSLSQCELQIEIEDRTWIICIKLNVTSIAFVYFASGVAAIFSFFSLLFHMHTFFTMFTVALRQQSIFTIGANKLFNDPCSVYCTFCIVHKCHSFFSSSLVLFCFVFYFVCTFIGFRKKHDRTIAINNSERKKEMK